MEPAPISLDVLTPCNDSRRKYQILTHTEPFTNQTYQNLHAPLCPLVDHAQKNYFSTVPIIHDGIPSHHHDSMLPLMTIPAKSTIVHFGGHVSGDPLKYSIKFLEVNNHRVDNEPNYKSVLSPEGIQLYRISELMGSDSAFMPDEGIFQAGTIDFGVKFSCDPNFNYQMYTNENNRAAGGLFVQFGMELRFESISGLNYGNEYQPVYLPFRKYCPSPTKGWFSDYGSMDDMGHFAGAFPLYVYCVLLLVNAMGGPEFVGRKRNGNKFWGLFVRLLSAQPMGREDGLLDSVMLLLGGGIPALIHFNTLTTNNSSMHELYHFMAHVFTFSMGIMSFCIRLLLPKISDLSLPLTLTCISLLFTLHKQHNPHSASLHGVYSGLMLLFSVFRILSHFAKDPPKGGGAVEKKKNDDWHSITTKTTATSTSPLKTATIFSAFCGIWGSLVLLVSSEDGVAWKINSRLDVPATSLLGGVIAAATTGAVLLALWCFGCGGVGKGRAGRKGEGGDGHYEMVESGGLLSCEGGSDDDKDDEDEAFVKNMMRTIVNDDKEKKEGIL